MSITSRCITLNEINYNFSSNMHWDLIVNVQNSSLKGDCKEMDDETSDEENPAYNDDDDEIEEACHKSKTLYRVNGV